MLPFINIFGLEVPMYGTMIITGVILAVILAVYRAGKNPRVTRLDMFTGAMIVFIVSILGAKILYLLTEFDFYCGNFNLLLNDPVEYFSNLAGSGLVFYGGFIGGALGLIGYCRVFRLNIVDYFDAAIPSIPLAHAFGRIGCFCAGCCYGKESEEFGIVFTNALTGVSSTDKVIPTQLIEAGFNLILCLVLILSAKRVLKRGTLTGLYMVCYGVFRFFNEYLRDDEIRGAFLWFSTSQWISLVLIIPVGILLLCGIGEKLSAGRKKEEEETESA